MKQKAIKSTDLSFHRVSEFFLSELRNGNAPSIEVFARAFPHLKEQILSDLPTVAMLEKSAGNDNLATKYLLNGRTQLGGCVIEEEIGRGAMGVVFRAYQTELKRKVAVKVLDLRGSASRSIKERFELERQAMARLDHPNIVPVYSYGTDKDIAFLIMKCIDGHSLHDLNDGAGDYREKVMFSELRAEWHLLAKMASDVASGLHHSHEQGLVHRDIKPGNLLLDRSGKIWITDYGLAKIHDLARSLSGTGDAIGTPRYMAPEQVRGLCDARSDIYSLGITMYELATQQKVWGGTSLTSLFEQRATLELEDVRKKNPEVPESLARIIMKACAFSPDDRYQTCKELQIVLDRFVAGITPSDRRRRRREPDDVFRNKSHRHIAIATAVTIMAVIGVSMSVHFMNSRSTELAAQAATQPRPRLVSANLLAKLADGKEEDLGKTVHEFFQESVREAGEEFHLAEQEKSEILSQWDDVTSKFKKGELSRDSIKTFSEGYRESTIPLGTKIVTLARLFERSSLPAQEQQFAFELLRSFAKATIHRAIEEREAWGMVNQLTGGQSMSAEEMSTIQIPIHHLRNWMRMVQRRLESVPRSMMGSLNIKEELERTIQRAAQQSNPNP